MRNNSLNILVGAIILTSTIAACFWLVFTPVEATITEEKSVPHPVSVIQVRPQQHTATITAYGQVAPYRKTNIVSAISGRLVQRSDVFDKGMRVVKGDLLATVEDVAYRSAVSQQKQELANAKLALMQEERRASQAKKDWERMGNKSAPSSALVLHTPQLDAAKARVDAAKASLAKAENDLRNTKITAPYDAAVISRNVAIGSYVSEGTVVGTIFGTDLLEVQLPLTEKQFSLLPIPPEHQNSVWKELPVKLSSVTTPEETWEGKLAAVDLQITKATRQRIAIIRISHPLTKVHPLLPGTFVKAEISGVSLENIYALPESSLTQQGAVWTIDSESTLKKVQADIKFRYQGMLYARLPNTSPLNIVVKPLGSYLVGTEVTPVSAEVAHE